MTDFVSRQEVQDFLRVTDQGERQVLEILITDLEALFNKLVGRSAAPFAAALTARTEIHDGTGKSPVWVDYPVATVTTVVLGRDVASPAETIDPTDVDKLIWQVGSRRLRRPFGSLGVSGAPGFVHVTYDTQDDRPADVDLAIKDVATTVWRQRGSEAMRSKRFATEGATFRKAIKDNPLWNAALAANKRMAVI